MIDSLLLLRPALHQFVLGTLATGGDSLGRHFGDRIARPRFGAANQSTAEGV
jgi:hypothetical protein